MSGSSYPVTERVPSSILGSCRIPVGYWSVPVTSGDTSYSTSPDPYIPGAWPYLLRGLSWARKHGVHVIIDLHGAPGSQNGYDNSGQRTGSPRWALDQDNVGRTVDVVKFIAQNVGGLIDVLELLNEPAGFRGDAWESAVRGFWEDGYDAVREVAGEEMRVMIGDAFLGVNVSFRHALANLSSRRYLRTLFASSTGRISLYRRVVTMYSWISYVKALWS